MKIANFFKDEIITAILIISSFVITITPALKSACTMTQHFSWTWITTTLVHADISTHWLSNIFIIALLGPVIERRFGIIRTVTMIILTTLATSFVGSLRNVAGIGMSDICFMFILLHCFCKENTGISFTCIVLILLKLIPELQQINANDHIGHAAHFIGGILGLVFGILNNKMEKLADKYYREEANSEMKNFSV